MTPLSLDKISQQEFDNASQLLVSGLKTSDPKLDTRKGTVLRSLVVNPEARIFAAVSNQLEECRKASSLKLLEEAENAGEQVNKEDLNAILSNFNIELTKGTKASGIVKVTVLDGTQAYPVAANTEFTTLDGLIYRTSKAYVAGDANYLDTGEVIPLYKGISSYFFLLPVESEDIGSKYNITQGTSLTPNISIYTFVGAEAFRTFNSGTDVPDIQTIINQIPTNLSLRGFVNRTASEGLLRSEFDLGEHPIVACSTVGYGDAAQRRDKHNVFGISVGGRIDLYVRNFTNPHIKTDVIEGSLKEDGIYELYLSPEKFPGSYWIKSIGLIYEDDKSTVLSPLTFSVTREPYNINNTWHDFDVRKNSSEIFNTMWQALRIELRELPNNTAELGGWITEEETKTNWPPTLKFVVSVYCLPQASELQEFVDRDDLRSISTDVVVRCPVICNTTIQASIKYDPNFPVEIDLAKQEIMSYINKLGFRQELTRSEIVHILKKCGATSVDLTQKDMLYGILYDAYGNKHILEGDSLNLKNLTDNSAMVTPQTTVFAIELEDIHILATPEK